MESSHEGESHRKEFERRYREELDELVDMGLFDDEPLPPDPSSMGIGETNFEELTDEEITIVREVLFKTLGVNASNPDSVQRTYTTEAPQEATVPGEIGVTVFKTNREDTFLQEMNYQDGKQRWV